MQSDHKMNRRCSKRTPLLLALLTGAWCMSAAQSAGPSADAGRWWVTAGAGVTTQTDFLGTTAAFVYTRELDDMTVSGRIVGANNFLASDGKHRLKAASDYGILADWKTRSDRLLFSAGGGIGLARFSYEGGSIPSQTTSAASIPLETQVLYMPSSFVGIGAYAFADINAERTFGGVMLMLQLGRLW